MAKGLSGELQCQKSARLPNLKLLIYKEASERAGTLFELTPTKLHLQVTNQITGAKRPVSSNVLWEKLTDGAKEGVKEGLGDIVSVEVVDSQVESSGEI
jgi:hypothetical protein